MEAALKPASRRRLTALLACYNRRALTLRCLRALHAQASAIDLHVILFDDGCSDGTGEAVRSEFPMVEIITGDGTAFWGGGMNAVMQAALRRGSFDDVLWLNDDVDLRPDALEILFDAQRRARSEAEALDHVIIGAVTEPGSSVISYAGYRRRSWMSPVWLRMIGPVEGALNPCDTMHGNVVLLPESVARAVGPNDPILIHELGDIDYGYRAVKAGARLWIAPEPVGECASNPRSRKTTPPGNLRQRWRALNTPHGLPFRPWRHFMWRHGRVLGMIELGTIYAKRLTGL